MSGFDSSVSYVIGSAKHGLEAKCNILSNLFQPESIRLDSLICQQITGLIAQETDRFMQYSSDGIPIHPKKFENPDDIREAESYFTLKRMINKKMTSAVPVIVRNMVEGRGREYNPLVKRCKYLEDYINDNESFLEQRKHILFYIDWEIEKRLGRYIDDAGNPIKEEDRGKVEKMYSVRKLIYKYLADIPSKPDEEPSEQPRFDPTRIRSITAEESFDDNDVLVKGGRTEKVYTNDTGESKTEQDLIQIVDGDRFVKRRTLGYFIKKILGKS